MQTSKSVIVRISALNECKRKKLKKPEIKIFPAIIK